jgi:hypothetical protein
VLHVVGGALDRVPRIGNVVAQLFELIQTQNSSSLSMVLLGWGEPDDGRLQTGFAQVA